MNTTFAAHIITAEAAMDTPEIVVMLHDIGLPIATYPILPGDDPIMLLWERGWRLVDNPGQADTNVEVGYDILAVEPAHYEQIVQDVTLARKRAQTEYKRQDAAWRSIIRRAMHDGVSPTALAEAAQISRARVYQIRDGRH